MNTCTIIGNLTKDPELRTTNSGLSACTFTVAVNRKPDKDGNRAADYISVVTWRGLADSCSKYLGKGSKVAVNGEIRTRSYDGKDGHKVYVTELLANDVEFLTQRNSKTEPAESGGFAEVEEDDNLPF